MKLFGTYFLTALALIVLRTVEVITWSWALVLAPFWLPPALATLLLGAVLAVIVIDQS